MESEDSLINSSTLLINEKFNIDQNIDYQLTKTSEHFTKLDMKASRSAFLPTLSGFYNHNIQSSVASFNFAPKDIVGINLSLPIFSSGERLAVLAQKRLTYEKAQNTSKLILNSLIMQATQYQNDVRLKLEKYRNQKKSNELSDTIYQRTIEKYKQGVASSMDLMNVQNQYLTNLTSYYQSIYELQEAKSRLEKLFNINPDSAVKTINN
jgi:outer membrane protein